MGLWVKYICSPLPGVYCNTSLLGFSLYCLEYYFTSFYSLLTWLLSLLYVVIIYYHLFIVILTFVLSTCLSCLDLYALPMFNHVVVVPANHITSCCTSQVDSSTLSPVLSWLFLHVEIHILSTMAVEKLFNIRLL